MDTGALVSLLEAVCKAAPKAGSSRNSTTVTVDI